MESRQRHVLREGAVHDLKVAGKLQIRQHPAQLNRSAGTYPDIRLAQEQKMVQSQVELEIVQPVLRKQRHTLHVRRPTTSGGSSFMDTDEPGFQLQISLDLFPWRQFRAVANQPVQKPRTDGVTEIVQGALRPCMETQITGVDSQIPR